MSEQPIAFDLLTARRFVRTVKEFFTSEVRWLARGLFALLIVFALTVNGLNVVNSYVGRDFMTAIEHRDQAGFFREAIRFVGILALSTVVVVLYRFTEERLGLFWRVWLTRRVTRRYLADRTYLHLKESATILNPDQRIADDVRVFTTTTLSFTLMFMNGVLAVLSFSGVLWTISPLLFGVAIGYAILGTLATIYLGRPLIGLNYRQSDQEATFRSDLIHVRENGDSIALLRHEGHLTTRLLRRIDGFADNFRRIVSVNRNLGFFTTGYNYLIQIIPALIVTPLFIRGKVEFGVITQSAVAFAQLLGAFSLIVNQFQSISSFAAVIARLSALVGAAEKGQPSPQTAGAVVGSDGRISYEGLTTVLARRRPRGAQEPNCGHTARDEGAGCWAERSRSNRSVSSHRRHLARLRWEDHPATAGRDLLSAPATLLATWDTPGAPRSERLRAGDHRRSDHDDPARSRLRLHSGASWWIGP